MKPIKLVSKRLILRRAQEGDADSLFHYTSDIECSKFLTRAPHTHIDQTQNFLDKCCDRPWEEGGDNFSWVVSLATNEEAIGILIINIEGPQAQVHFGMRKEFWHNGYCSEFLKISTDWLLSHDTTKDMDSLRFREHRLI